MNKVKTPTGKVYFSNTDLETLKQLVTRQLHKAESTRSRMKSEQERSFYATVQDRLATFLTRCETLPEGESILPETELKWLNSLVSQEQKVAQAQFDAARKQAAFEAIALGGYLERLYSVSYQLSLPLERRANRIARSIKVDEAAAEQARAEALARKVALQKKKRNPLKVSGSPTDRPIERPTPPARPAYSADRPAFPRSGPRREFNRDPEREAKRENTAKIRAELEALFKP